MRIYEIMLLVSGDLSEVEINNTLDDFKKELENVKGKITFEDVWGRRELAYPIKNQEEGFYVVYKMELDPAVLTDFEKVLLLNNNILRYLITISLKEIGKRRKKNLQLKLNVKKRK